MGMLKPPKKKKARMPGTTALAKRKKLVKRKLREVARELTHLEAKGICLHCGKPVQGRNGHMSHVKPKGAHRRMEFDPENLMFLCYFCHMQFWHKDVLEAAEWFRTTFPVRYDSLVKKAAIKEPYKLEDMEADLAMLQSNLAMLKSRVGDPR